MSSHSFPTRRSSDLVVLDHVVLDHIDDSVGHDDVYDGEPSCDDDHDGEASSDDDSSAGVDDDFCTRSDDDASDSCVNVNHARGCVHPSSVDDDPLDVDDVERCSHHDVDSRFVIGDVRCGEVG